MNKALRWMRYERQSIREMMRRTRLRDVNLERFLTGRWPIVAPKPRESEDVSPDDREV